MRDDSQNTGSRDSAHSRKWVPNSCGRPWRKVCKGSEEWAGSIGSATIDWKNHWLTKFLGQTHFFMKVIRNGLGRRHQHHWEARGGAVLCRQWKCCYKTELPSSDGDDRIPSHQPLTVISKVDTISERTARSGWQPGAPTCKELWK